MIPLSISILIHQFAAEGTDHLSWFLFLIIPGAKAESLYFFTPLGPPHGDSAVKGSKRD
jgi:hypothetical protein